MVEAEGTNRGLWREAYRFYQEWAKKLDGSGDDLAGYFCALTEEVMGRCKEYAAEGREMWKGIYAMLSERAKM